MERQIWLLRKHNSKLSTSYQNLYIWDVVYDSKWPELPPMAVQTHDQILHCHWWKFWSRDSDLSITLLIISRVSNRHSAFRQNYAELRAIIVFACSISLRGIALWLWTRKQLNIQGIACNGIALQRLFHLKFSNFEVWLKMVYATDIRIEMNRSYLCRFQNNFEGHLNIFQYF